jgi:hypothetical protein
MKNAFLIENTRTELNNRRKKNRKEGKKRMKVNDEVMQKKTTKRK